MRFFRVFAFLSFAALVTMAACSDDDGEAAHSLQCSTGPQLYSTSYPPQRAQSANFTALPACVPRCGQDQKYNGLHGAPYSPEYSMAAIPSGKCEFQGDHCSIIAGTTRTCGTETGTCDVSLFECFCEDDTWHC